MKEEKGKILLQPSFTLQQQQQTQHIKTNSTTKQHDKQSLTTKRKTDINNGRTTNTNQFFKTSKGQQTQKKKKSNINIFNTPSNLKKK